MKKIKKAGQQLNRKYTGKVKHAVSRVFDRIDSRFQTRRKIAAMNAWAEEHPKRFFKYAIGFFMLMFFVGMYTLLPDGKPRKSDELPMGGALSEIHSTSDIIERMGQIHSRNVTISRLSSDLKYNVGRIQHEIDSIMKRRPMTHEDSVEVAWRLHKLEVITNTLISE